MSLILLHPHDNVLVVTAVIAPGDVLTIDGERVAAVSALPVGHKVARIDLLPGDRIYKHGAPIGSMTAAARAGDHVHLHNMQSDYIASHTRATLEGKRSQ